MKKKHVNEVWHSHTLLKILRIMKLTLGLLLLLIVQGWAINSYSQKVVVNLDLKNADIIKVLDEIEKQTDYYFLFNYEQIHSEKKIDVKLSNSKIDEVLNKILEGTGLNYSIKNRQIVISKDTSGGLNEQFSSSSSQQQKSISGKVTDTSGGSLPGVSVVVKGTTTGTITDGNGNYSLPNVPENATLQFSFVGMKGQEIAVAGKTDINVTLLDETIGIDEVVAIGYGTKIKGELTGAIAKVDSKTFEARPITNAANALQGALPGLTVLRGSGQPGAENYTLQIRGISSYSGNKALILIDGVTGDLNTLNPNDIADVTVLKDAAASIYGARASDGVVLVTTKKGKTGNPSISYSGNFGIKTPQFLKTMTNTLELVEMYNEGMKNIGLTGASQEVIDKIKANAEPDAKGWMTLLENYPGFYGSTDWMDVLYGRGYQQTHNLSISGGGANNTYLFSAGYSRDEGIFNFGENHSDRYNLRMNYGFNLYDRLNIETNTSFDNQATTEPPGLGSTLSLAQRAWSYLPVYNSMGQPWVYQGYTIPINFLERTGLSKSNYSKISTSIKGDLKIINDLKLVSQIGIALRFDDSNSAVPTSDKYDWYGKVIGQANKPNRASYSNSKNFYGLYSSYLDYNKKLWDHHRINMMVGASHEENDYSRQSINGYNFASNEVFTLNLADRTKVEYSDFTGNASDWALTSYFGRFNYSFDGKYFIDFTSRIDGSSKFAPSKRWSAAFPAVLAAWNLSKENFIKSLNTFDNLKLRASWGQSGNQELSFGNYDYISLISISGSYPMGSPNAGYPGAVPSIASEVRTWETIETSNAGIDFALMKSRLSGSFDYYVKLNKNMLVNEDLPAVLGGTAPTRNIGKLKTNGWDISIGWKDKINDFKYSITAIVSDSKNKLTELRGNDSYKEGLVYAREGYSLQSYFGYQFDGFIKNATQLTEYKKLSNLPTKIGIGDVMYRDLDGDGIITAFGDGTPEHPGDMKYLGNMLPRYTYSANLDLSYKNFNLSVFLQGVGKRDGFRTGNIANPFYFVFYQPLKYFYGKNFTPENPDAKYPRIIPGGLGFDDLRNWNWRYSSMQMNNLAYLRVKLITLGYNLPQSFCNKIKMQNLRIYVSGADLFTFSKGTWNKSYDPEEGWSRSDDQTYPFSSVISMGLDVKF